MASIVPHASKISIVVPAPVMPSTGLYPLGCKSLTWNAAQGGMGVGVDQYPQHF